MSNSAKELVKQLDFLVEGAEEFKKKHGSCRVTVGPNSAIAKARIQRVADFWVEVDEVTLVSAKGDDDIKIDGPLVYFRSFENVAGLTATDIAGAVDWMGFGSGEVEFNSADWSNADKGGEIYLEGRAKKALVGATFVLRDFSVARDWDDDWEE